MSVPRRIVFTRKARADFTSILLYTEQQWGERQKEIYAEPLTAALGRLAHFPELGEPCDDKKGFYAQAAFGQALNMQAGYNG